MEYQHVNPTTQVALFSVCSGVCQPINYITWTVYSGVMNSSSNIVQWTPFNQMSHYRDIWFFGISLLFLNEAVVCMTFLGYNITNFTSLNNLFLSNSSIVYWRFQVTYSIGTETSSGALNFLINQPPQNGTCLITPSNGTTSTVFTISCSNWVDDEEIRDYTFYSTFTAAFPRNISYAPSRLDH